MRITLDEEAREYIESTMKEWQCIADEYCKNMDEFKNWKRSPILRENRRESIVYGNCRQTLRMILNIASNPELFEGEPDMEGEEEIVEARPLPPIEYAGQWIAISHDNEEILAHGDTLADVRAQMYNARIGDASYEKLPPLRGEQE